MQMSLFDTDPKPKPREESQGLARRTDPESSHKAAAEIRSRVSVQKDRVYQYSVECGTPMTAKELAFGASIPGEDIESYRKRVSLLVKEGRLKVVGEKKCSITGKQVQAYMPV